MSERLLIAYCTNGLGNRLHPLASAMAYCRLTGRRLAVYWDSITPSGCLAPLHRLYHNEFETLSLRELATMAGRKVGLYTECGAAQGVNREAQHFGRDALQRLAQRSTPQPVQALRLDDPHEVVVAFGNDFLDGVPVPLSVAALRSLRPREEIRSRVLAEARRLDLALSTQAVHARGTDFQLRDALAIYVPQIRQQIGHQRFLLSTEDAQLEADLRRQFQGQVLSRHDRLHLQLNPGKSVWTDPDSYTNSAEHVVDALVDIYLLSCVSLVVAHPRSTFAAIARHLHGVLSGVDAAHASAAALEVAA